MSNGFLSQDEIDSLLRGDVKSDSKTKMDNKNDNLLTDIEKDILGEVGNISMGSASTALSQCTNHSVNITTPVVGVTTLKYERDHFDVPNIVLEVGYTSGISGKNLLVIKITDALIIANLMMGGDGKPEYHELSDIEISAVQEAMNQMIGSAATSMATMFSREVNISPPRTRTWEENTYPLCEGIDENEQVIKVSFKLTIGNFIDSSIMQIITFDMAKKITSIMMGHEEDEFVNDEVFNKEPVIEEKHDTNVDVVEDKKDLEQQKDKYVHNREENRYDNNDYGYQGKLMNKSVETKYEEPVEVSNVNFKKLDKKEVSSINNNIDLILDVPLEISVVLGRSRKTIKEILELGNGSLIELDKLADEPVEILVNGKKIANGEVVVVDENFGVRITNVISGEERIKSLR